VAKNALDLIEDTPRDLRPYFHHLPVEMMVTAYRRQATRSTMAASRSTVDVLRGWPIPFAAAINSLKTRIDADIGPNSTAVDQLGRVTHQVARAASVMADVRPRS
jgi:FMN reductase